MGAGKLVIGRVAGEGGDGGNATLLEHTVDFEAVTTNVVLAQQVDLILARLHLIILTNHMAEHLVVGDMVTSGLGNTFVALAAEGKDVTVAEFFLHVSGYRMNIVTNQTNRTGGKDGNRPGMEQVVTLLDSLGQLLLTAENDIGILHVGGKTVGHVVLAIRTGVGLVPAGQPGVETAADRAMHQVDDVAGRPHDNALTTGVGTTAHGDDAGDGADVRLNLRGGIFQGLVDQNLLGPFTSHFGRIFTDQLFLDVRGFPLNELFLCSCHVVVLLGLFRKSI